MQLTQMTSYLPSPIELGLPAKFTSWRPRQEEGIFEILDQKKRFLALAAPTGFGKSPVYIAAAVLSGKRVAVLTSTKPQQDQLRTDFSCINGFIDIRGQNNYRCNLLEDRWVSVEKGPCHSGIKCDLLHDGCSFFDLHRRVRQAQIVVTNYQFWLHQAKLDPTRNLGPVDILICDEAHDARDQLGDFLKIEITRDDFTLVGEKKIPSFKKFSEWQAAAHCWLGSLQHELLVLETRVAEMGHDHTRVPQIIIDLIRHGKNLERRLTTLTQTATEWISQTKHEVVSFDPVWPAEYNFSLFGDVPQIVLTSAVIRPKDLELLGIKPEDSRFVEYPSSFPTKNRPVIHVPSVRMDKKTTPVNRDIWLEVIEAIIEPRQNWKAIIHTVSFERARWLQNNSRFGKHFLVNNSWNTAAIIEQFRASSAPTILVSPSVSTGLGFAYDECRYQIICKVPFPDTSDLVLQARCNRDRQFHESVAAQLIVQSSGRSNRYEDDWSEVFIVDEHFKWLFRKSPQFFPKFFREALRFSEIIPEPLGLRRK